MRLPVYKAPPPAAPVWSWSGCYLGGHAGGLWATQKDWIVRTPGGDFFGQSLGQHDEHSFVGGAQAGCDYQDRKSTRLNSSHLGISYAVFCLKKKKKKKKQTATQ